MTKSTFLLLCLEGSILSFNVAAASALIPSISAEFNLAPLFVGKIIWLYMLPYGITALIYGPGVRFFEIKKIELICLFLFSLANLLVGLSPNINTLFLGRFFMGVFGAAVIPLVLILIGNLEDEKNRGRLVGIFFSSTFIASLLGLFLSGIINWRWIFLIPGILGIVLILFMFVYLPKLSAASVGIKINYLSAFKSKAVVTLFTYIFFISLFYHGIQQWLSVYFSTHFGLRQFVISILVMLTSLSGIFGEVLGGWLSDTLSRIRTIKLGIVLMVLSTFLLIFKAPIAFLAILMLIWGLGWTINHAGVSTLLTDLPKEFLNEAASLNSSIRFLSGGLGALLGGVLIRMGFNLWIFVFGFSLILLALTGNKILIEGQKNE